MAGCFFAVPLVHEYVDADYGKTEARGISVGVAATAALAIVGANDCVAWFNFVLFFHAGVEATVLDRLQSYALTDTTLSESEIWAWIGFGVIIAHLLPFFLMDHNAMLVPLAVVGVPINTAVVVFLDSGKLMYVGLSASMLLGTTLYVCGQCEKRCSVMTLMKDAMGSGTMMSCRSCIM